MKRELVKINIDQRVLNTIDTKLAKVNNSLS